MDKRSHMPHQHKVYLRRREVSDGRTFTVVPLSKPAAKIDVTLCEAQEWNIPWQDPRIAANALRVGPHPPSSTVPLPHRGRLKRTREKRPVGLDLIRLLRNHRRSFAPSACRCFPRGEGLFSNEVERGGKMVHRSTL